LALPEGPWEGQQRGAAGPAFQEEEEEDALGYLDVEAGSEDEAGECWWSII
jgi:hypothetical protein